MQQWSTWNSNQHCGGGSGGGQALLPGVGPGDQLFYFPLQAVIVCGKYDQAVLLRLALLRFRVLPPILRSVSARPLSTLNNHFCGGRHTHGIQRTASARSPSSATSCLASSRRPSVIASTCWCRERRAGAGIVGGTPLWTMLAPYFARSAPAYGQRDLSTLIFGGTPLGKVPWGGRFPGRECVVGLEALRERRAGGRRLSGYRPQALGLVRRPSDTYETPIRRPPDTHQSPAI